jgi:hypothetical protein
MAPTMKNLLHRFPRLKMTGLVAALISGLVCATGWLAEYTGSAAAQPAEVKSSHPKAVSEPLEEFGLAGKLIKVTDLPAKEKPRDIPAPDRFLGRATRVKRPTEGGNFTPAAVAAGLRWLSQHQGRDGHWSLQKFCADGKCNCRGEGSTGDDVAGTALGVLPFLGAGQAHKGGPRSDNVYAKQVELALKYLRAQQKKDGAFSQDMTSHALATLAICEAFGLSADKELKEPAQRALKYIIDAQSAEGGWRYQRKQSGYDTSISGWQLQALKAGQWAGLKVPEETFEKCGKWLDHAETGPGAYGYAASSLKDEKPRPSLRMSAVGLVCRQYTGWKWTGRWPADAPSKRDVFLNYYCTLGRHDVGGKIWEDWNPVMRDFLIASQNQGADAEHRHEKGSWFTPEDPISANYGGRLFETSLSLLMLEVYYRYPSLLEPAK